MVYKHISKEEQEKVEEYISKNLNHRSMNQTVTHESVRNEISFRLTCKSENQKKFTQAIDKSEIAVCYGLAGGGKTYVSMMKALQYYMKGKIQKIYLIKSVTPIPGEELGFLKGNMKDKIEPFAYSFIHACKKIIGEPLVRKLEHLGVIEFLPIAFLRGASLGPRAMVVVDEAQNISVASLRTILTRIEKGTKVIILGDTKQVDMKKGSHSSLKYFIDHFKDYPENEISFVEFTKVDQVRNPLINKLEDTFDELEKKDPGLFGKKPM